MTVYGCSMERQGLYFDRLKSHTNFFSQQISKKAHLVSGSPGEKICDVAQNEHVSFIIMGSRGLNALRRTFTGSVSDYVLRHSHVPVTVVPPAK